MSQFSSRIHIEVKNISDWENAKKIDSPYWKDAEGIFSLNNNSFVIDSDWSCDSDELYAMVCEVVRALGDSCIIIADSTDINVDPYTYLIYYFGDKIINRYFSEGDGQEDDVDWRTKPTMYMFCFNTNIGNFEDCLKYMEDTGRIKFTQKEIKNLKEFGLNPCENNETASNFEDIYEIPEIDDDEKVDHAIDDFIIIRNGTKEQFECAVIVLNYNHKPNHLGTVYLFSSWDKAKAFFDETQNNIMKYNEDRKVYIEYIDHIEDYVKTEDADKFTRNEYALVSSDYEFSVATERGLFSIQLFSSELTAKKMLPRDIKWELDNAEDETKYYINPDQDFGEVELCISDYDHQTSYFFIVPVVYADIPTQT